ncbi:MAG: SMP-30/gluconolactonase/LRE family protein [bacterium]
MKIRIAILALLPALLPMLAIGQQADTPKGEVAKYSFENSRVFPGTYRDYWVYVPKQYDPAKPACVFVCQDGIQYNAPAEFDKLIAAGEMPVTIGVFVMHGRVKAQTDKALDRFNRSFEYDGLGDNYARFILDELLPDVETKKTADGRAIKFSKNGNDRAIAGNSSGAICAFTAAWERPDAFSRVFSAIGTYVGLRGGNVYPTLIRKYEPKPIRIFLQDGSNDLNIYGGDWWMANQEMQRALVFAGYDVRHIWGDGGHNGKQAGEVFADAMKWLWRDWPEPVSAGKGSQQLQEILLPGEGWELVGDGYQFTEGPTADASGTVYFNDIPNNKTYKIGADGKPVVINDNSNRSNGMGYGPDGKRYVVSTGTEQILAIDAENKAAVIAEGIRGNDLVTLKNGNVYVTNPSQTNEPGKVWLIKPNGEKSVVDTGLNFPNGVTASPDQSLLYVAEARSHWVWSYQIQPDGSLKHKQRYYHLHMPDTADAAGADGMRVDRDGRLYVATRMGIQVCDQAGRVNCIIPTPNGKSSNLTFGGADFRTIYVTAGEKVYRRKVKTTGANAWQEPHKPAAPRL